ncbi:MAG: YigZ family protein [Vicinamibacteria bacterium]
MAYNAPKAPARFEQEIKRSRFIGVALPVSTFEELEAQLERIRREFRDATHHCWASVIGNPDAGPRMRFDDAGEPGGTAGKPILGVLQHRAVEDALVVVVRYFGGVKLGAGGLVRAYSGTASRVLDLVELVTVTPRSDLGIVIDYGDESAARRILDQLGIGIDSVDYGDSVAIRVRVSEGANEALTRELLEHTSGRARLLPY